jgi:hypothetical protein
MFISKAKYILEEFILIVESLILKVSNNVIHVQISEEEEKEM